MVDQAAAHEDLSFLFGQAVERCVDDLYAVGLQFCRIQRTYVCLVLDLDAVIQYMKLDFACTASEEASDAFDVDIAADRKLQFFFGAKRQQAPVDQVRAIALRGVFLREVCKATQYLLAGSRLLTAGAIPDLIGNHQGPEGHTLRVAGILRCLRRLLEVWCCFDGTNRLCRRYILRTHIVNYAKTRPVYDAYRKAGYSKRFLENHRAEITLHKAAKAAFDESNLKTLPKVKELDAEYSKLLTEKKALYPDYRKAKDEMQELLRAQRNVELFFVEEKNTTEKTQSR